MLRLVYLTPAIETFLVPASAPRLVCSWCDGSLDQSFMVDPLSYFSFQPVRHDWCIILLTKMVTSSVRTRERNVLFNDALNTFYQRLYGVGHMVKDHSDSEKGNLLPPHRLLFPINSRGSFICTIPQTG